MWNKGVLQVDRRLGSSSQIHWTPVLGLAFLLRRQGFGFLQNLLSFGHLLIGLVEFSVLLIAEVFEFLKLFKQLETLNPGLQVPFFLLFDKLDRVFYFLLKNCDIVLECSIPLLFVQKLSLQTPLLFKKNFGLELFFSQLRQFVLMHCFRGLVCLEFCSGDSLLRSQLLLQIIAHFFPLLNSSFV